MADNKGTHSPERRARQVLKFPQVKGKTLANVAVSADIDYFVISLRFQDRTALHLEVEPGVTVFADLSDWKTGDWRGIKRWKPIRSKSSRL